MWGCLWFKVWKDLVEQAVAQGQQLVGYYFPDEAGQGEVSWEELPSHSLLRDKVLKDWCSIADPSSYVARRID